MAQSCLETRPSQIVCYDDGATLTSLLMHVICENGKPIGQAYTTHDDTETPIDTSTGTVTLGACEGAPTPDVEWERMCDTLGTGVVVEFFRQSIVRFNTDGSVLSTTVTDLALDKTTAYTVAGTEGACNQDCDPVGSQGTVTDWSSF